MNNDVKNIDDMNNEDMNMMKLMDTINYDEKTQFLEDISIDEFEINDGQRTKIKLGVMKQLKPSSLKRFMKAGILAAGITLCVLLSALSPIGRKTLAEIVERLYFIPGLGKAEVNKGEDIFILPAPIDFSYKQTTVTVSSITKNSTLMTINMYSSNGFSNKIGIDDEKGNRYLCTFYSEGHGNGTVGSYNFEIPINLNSFNIILSEDDKIPVTLRKAESYADYNAMGPTDVSNNLGLTLVPTILGDKIKFDLIQHQYNDSQITYYGKCDKEGHPKINILINDDNYNSITVEFPKSYMGTLSSFNFTPNINSKSYTVKIPEVTLKYNVDNKVTIPMPKEGETDVNEVIDLHGFPLKITRVKREGTNVTLYLDTSYDKNKPENINYVFLDMDAMSIDYLKWNLNDQITTESLEFYIDPNDKKLKIYFKELYTILKGPWEFKISTDN